MVKVMCRCKRSYKIFKKDLNMPFFIDECCEAAGYDFKGDLVNKPKNVEGRDEELHILMKEYLELYSIKELKQAIEKRKVEKVKENQQLSEAAVAPSEDEAVLKQIKALNDKYIQYERLYNKSRSKEKRARFKREYEEAKAKMEELKNKENNNVQN